MKNKVVENIIFIHGNSCSSEYFYPQKEDQLFSEVELHFIDLIGHGSKYISTTVSDYSILSQAEIIYDYILNRNLKNVIIVGHSLGGHIAIRVKSIDRQDVISGLFLYGVTPFDSNQSFNLAFQQRQELGLLFQGNWSDQDVLNVKNILFSDLRNKEDDKRISKILANSHSLSRINLAKNLAIEAPFDEVAFLSQLTIPVQILKLKKDLIINNSYFDNLPNEFDIVEVDLGHSPHIESPHIFNRLLLEYIEHINWIIQNDSKDRESTFFNNF